MHRGAGVSVRVEGSAEGVEDGGTQEDMRAGTERFSQPQRIPALKESCFTPFF